jgi:hypothetical protein
MPLAWAMTQNNLGNALQTLGERESGTKSLEAAVAAYREALKEYTREKVPLGWAMTRANLGYALELLGMRKKDPDVVCEALKSELGAWEVSSTGGDPHLASIAANNGRRQISLLTENFKSASGKCIVMRDAAIKQMAAWQ